MEDEGGEGGVLGAEMDGEGGTGSGAVDDDGGDGRGAGGEEVVESGVGVGLHGVLGGMLAARAAEAAVVEEQDVEVGGVEEAGAGEGVGHGAVAGVEEKSGAGGGGGRGG